MMKFLTNKVMWYALGALAVVTLGLMGTVYVQGKIAEYKDFQIAQLELDVKAAKLDTLIKVAEAKSEAHKEEANEDINTTLSDKRIFTGLARL